MSWQEQVDELIKRLPEGERKIGKMFLDGYSVAEISHKTHCGTKHIKEVRKRMRELSKGTSFFRTFHK